MSALDCIQLIDHTSLGDNDSNDKIKKLIDEAVGSVTLNGAQVTTAAICIWPEFVKFAKSYNSDIIVATVVNFPRGDMSIDDVVKQTAATIEDGADEIDLVINYKLLISDEEKGAEEVYKLCKAIKHVCSFRPLKVILETGMLGTSKSIHIASVAALKGGADTLKTSTGKVAVNATPEAARVMLEAIATEKPTAGFKAAGGVKSLADAQIYLNLFREITKREPTKENFRFGASSLLAVLVNELPQESKVSLIQAPTGATY